MTYAIAYTKAVIFFDIMYVNGLRATIPSQSRWWWRYANAVTVPAVNQGTVYTVRQKNSIFFIYLRQRRRYMRLPAMFVWLSVSKITQKRVHGFGWNFACRQVSGNGRTDQLLSPIRIIVRMPEPENIKSRQTGTSLRAGYRSRDAL